MKGRLDRLDRLPNGDIAIVDYKTGKAKTQEDADDSLQLSIYALAAKGLGHTPSSLVFINLTNGTAVESRRSEDQLRAARSKIAEIAGKISAGEFDPNPGFAHVPGVLTAASVPGNAAAKNRCPNLANGTCQSVGDAMIQERRGEPKSQKGRFRVPFSSVEVPLVLLFLRGLLSLLCSLFRCHGFYSPFPFVMEHCDIHIIAIC